MSRDLSRSSALQAAVAAALVIGVMLLLVLQGKDGDDPDGGTPESRVVPAQELSDGMTSIASDVFFATVTAAQREAGTWWVLSVSRTDGQASPPSAQEISVEGETPAIRTVFDSGLGTIEALYIGDEFYIKGFTGTETPWWRVTSDDAAGQLINSLAAYADPTEFLSSITDLREFEVVGVEEVRVAEQDEMVKAVHYRMKIDSSAGPAPDGSGEGAATVPVSMEMWVDEDNRPVRVETVAEEGGQRLETTLYYVLYGEEVELEAPPEDQVTTEAPPGLDGADEAPPEED